MPPLTPKRIISSINDPVKTAITTLRNVLSLNFMITCWNETPTQLKNAVLIPPPICGAFDNPGDGWQNMALRQAVSPPPQPRRMGIDHKEGGQKGVDDSILSATDKNVELRVGSQ